MPFISVEGFHVSELYSEIQFVEEQSPAIKVTKNMIEDSTSLLVECQRQRAGEKISLAFHDTEHILLEVGRTQQGPDDSPLRNEKDVTMEEEKINLPVEGNHTAESSFSIGDSLKGKKSEEELNKCHEGDASCPRSDSRLTGEMLSNGVSEEDTSFRKDVECHRQEEELNQCHEENASFLKSHSQLIVQRLSNGVSDEETCSLEENCKDIESRNGGSFSLNYPQRIERGSCLEQEQEATLNDKLHKSDAYFLSVEGKIRDTTKESEDTVDQLCTLKSIKADTSDCHEPCIPHQLSSVASRNDMDQEESTTMEQRNSSHGETILFIEKVAGDAENGNRGGESGPLDAQDLEQDHASALWVKWRGKWQTGIQCPRADCPLSTLRAKPTHDRKRYIPVFFPRTKLYSWTDMLLVRSIDELPEPLAYGTHRKWRKMVKDLALPHRYVMQKLAIAMLNISDQLHTEAVIDNARKATTWKEFAMEASECKDYNDLGRMLLKLQTMILPGYISSDWTENSFDSWTKRCLNARNAESIELLTEELMDSVLWLEVDELWNAPVQPDLGPEWKTWKQEAMKSFFASHPSVAAAGMEEKDCIDSLVVGDENNRKRPKLEVRRAETCTSQMEAPTCRILLQLDGVKDNSDHSNAHEYPEFKLPCQSSKVEKISSVALAMENCTLVRGCSAVRAEAKDLQCVLMPEMSTQANTGREKAALEDSTGVNYMKKYRKCLAFVPTKGRQCERWANDGEIYCCVHLNVRLAEKLSQEEQKLPVEAPMCEGMTTHGRKCKHRARYGSTFCKKHCLQINLELVNSDRFMDSSRNAPMQINGENQVHGNLFSSEIKKNEFSLTQEVQSTQGNLIPVVVGETLDERNCLMKESELSNALPIVRTTPDVPRCIGQYSLSNGEQCLEYARRHTLYCEKHLPRFLKRARNGRSRLVSKDIFMSLLKNCTSRKQKLYLHQSCELLYGFMKRGLSRQNPVSRGDIMTWILSEATKDPDLGECLLKLVTNEQEKLSTIWGFNAEKNKAISSAEIKASSTSMARKKAKYTEVTVKCKICSDEFADDHKLGMHWAEVHKKEARWLFRGYACSVCMSSFTNRKVLETHVRERHGEQFLEHSIIFRCMSCNAHFVNTEQLWQHVLSFHAMDFRLQDQSQQPFDQAIEPKTNIISNVSSRSDLSENHDGSQKLACRFCGLKFDLLPDLGRHHQVAHMNSSSISQFPLKRSNHGHRRGRHSYPRFKKGLGPSFRYDNHTNNSSEKHFKSASSVLPVQGSQNQASELLCLGPLQDSHCSEVAATLFSKIQKTKPRPCNLEILSIARSACCKMSLLSALELTYGILPGNAYLKALKLCSELNIQVNWHQEGFICPRGCKPLTSSHSLAPLKLIADEYSGSPTLMLDVVNGAQWEIDESHCILDQKHFSCETKKKAIILCEDVSFGRERIPITCVVDEDLMDSFHKTSDEVSSIQKLDISVPWQGFNYVTERLIDPSLGLDTKNLQLGCSCGSPKCSADGCDHVYLFENDFSNAEDIYGNPMGGRFAYDERGRIILEEGYLVYECNSMCNCDNTCQNRVLQRGVQLKLEIFRTKKKGWAVRAREAISRGTFVCEYIGEVLNDEEANKRGERYDSDGCSYLYDIDAHIDGARGFSEGMTPYVIDATKYGNVSRFINHSCSPNLVNYLVLVESMDCQLAHIGLYANRDIAVGEELSYDYRYKLLPGDGWPCYCGAPNCRGRLY